MDSMAKRKKKRFSATKAVKAAAREHVGMPPPTRRVEDPKKKRKEKYKPSLKRMLGESE
jgi:hypothetical protein